MAKKKREQQQAPTNTAETSGGNPLTRGLTYVFGPLTRDNLWGWIKIILIILVIRWAMFEPYKIPSGSMEPTLSGDPRIARGDRVFINKFHYGLRVPFMDKRLFRWHAPERWEIVVFHAPHDDATHKTLIKRIVGLPGERIAIRDGGVHVDDERLELPPDMEGIEYYDSLRITDPMHVDVLMRMPPAQREAELRRINETYPMRYGILPDDEYALVPEDHYLMLGDNSGNSVDGRVWGWVPQENIVGRAFSIWWPMARWRDFTGWTATWWGMLILYGVPTGIAGYTAYSFVRNRRGGSPPPDAAA